MQNELIKYDGGFVASNQILKLIAEKLTQSQAREIPKLFATEEEQEVNFSLKPHIPNHITQIQYAEQYILVSFDNNFNKWQISYTKETAKEVEINEEMVPGAILLFDGVKTTINMKEEIAGGSYLSEAFIESAVVQIKQQHPQLRVERPNDFFPYPTIEVSDPTSTLKQIKQQEDWNTRTLSNYKEFSLHGPIQFKVRYDDSTLFGGELDEVINMPVQTRSPIQIPVVAERGEKQGREKIVAGQNERWAWLPEPYIGDFKLTNENSEEIKPHQYRFNVLSQMIYFLDHQRLTDTSSLYLDEYYYYHPPTPPTIDDVFNRPNKYTYYPTSWSNTTQYRKIWFIYWTQWKLVFPESIENITNKIVIQSPEIFVELRDNGDNIEIAYGTQLNAEKNELNPNSSSVFVKIDKGANNPIRYQLNWSGDFFNLVLNGNYAYCGRLGGSKQYALTATCANFTPTQKWGPKTGNGQTDIIAGQWYQAHYPKALVVPPQFVNSTAIDPNATEFISPIYVYHDYDKTIGYLQGVACGHINLGEEGTRFVVDKTETDSSNLPVHPLTKQPIYQGQLYVPPPEKEYVQQPLEANNTLFSSLPNQGLTLLFRTK